MSLSKSAISHIDDSYLLTQSKSLANIIQIRSLEKLIKGITVKISSESQSWGSGVLVHRSGDIYTLITNDHVIRSKKILVTTFDGKAYDGRLVDRFMRNSIDIDLAIVQFQSKQIYPIATISNYQNLLEGDTVIAAGYPLEKKNGDKVTGLKTTKGYINLLVSSTLRRGHGIAYSNAIERGMSGGPVLDINGNLIAINARQAYPTNDLHFFQDAKLAPPCKPQNDLMFRSALGIPINIVANQSKKLINFDFAQHRAASDYLVGPPPVLINFIKIHPQFQDAKREEIIMSATTAKKCLL